MPLLRAMSDTVSDQRRFAVVILAAGQGTRMRSDTHKVLHPIASRPLLLHLLDCVDALGADKRVVVVGKGREQVEAAIAGRDVTIAIQADQKGTGHAVQQAAEALEGYDGPVVILYGDTPFVRAGTLRRMIDRLSGAGTPGIVVLASSPADPLKYGRIILGEGDRIAKMVEFKDATEQARDVRLCNSGMMAVRAKDLFRWLGQVGNDNAAGEYY
jgi:bifunctional UDP-N-acetylglucosamine pyrophosphorylase/glucosamine-1-phosphate N-acetyltransferase